MTQLATGQAEVTKEPETPVAPQSIDDIAGGQFDLATAAGGAQPPAQPLSLIHI